MARPRIPISVEHEFWALVRQGVRVADAGPAVGVSRAQGERIYGRAGGVIPRPPVPAATCRLRVEERHQIAVLIKSGASVRSIAALLDRSPSTISRELRRNGNAQGGYFPAAAQSEADARLRERGRAGSPAKLAVNLRLRMVVIAGLLKRWSPVQISNRLKVTFPDDLEMRVSHETIYQSLYVQSRGALKKELTAYLRQRKELRKPRVRTRAKAAGGRFPGMVNISERPAEAADRAVPGHWEGDLIMGAANASAVGTLVERATRFVMLLHLPDGHGAEAVSAALSRKIVELPEQLSRSLTWDQGSEMASHLQFSESTGVPVYFCDPHSPWQRGSNENTNGLLRQYLPKSTDLSVWSLEQLDEIAAELNDRPRKTLGWLTPREELAKVLSVKDYMTTVLH